MSWKGKTRRAFKFLEYTFNKKMMPLEVLKRGETSVAVVSSPSFVDPAEHPEAKNNGITYQSSS